MLATLRLFRQVVKRGSITAAGRALGLSTTAASRQMQELEAALQARLLNRTTRNVSATEAGQHLFDRLGPLLEDLDGVLRAAGDEHGQPTGTLRVVARRSFGLLHVAPTIASFHARFPQVSVELTLTEVMDLRPSSGVDVVIRLGRPDEKTLHSTRLAADRRVLCASPAYLARVAPPAEPGDCARHACLAYHREDEPALWIFEQDGKRRDIAVTGPLRSNSGEVLHRAALDGLGLALLPAWMVADDVETGKLQPCLPDIRAYPAGYQAEIYAVHARAEFVPAKITAFIAHLTGQVPVHRAALSP